MSALEAFDTVVSIAAWLGNGRAEEIFLALAENSARPGVDQERHEASFQIGARMLRETREIMTGRTPLRQEVFWVSADMSAVVATAAESFPRTSLGGANDVVAQAGFALFDRPMLGAIEVAVDGSDQPDCFHGLSWHIAMAEVSDDWHGPTFDGQRFGLPAASHRVGVGVMMNTWSTLHDIAQFDAHVDLDGMRRAWVGAPLIPGTPYLMMFGVEPEEGPTDPLVRVARTLWRMAQQRIAVTRRETVPRAAVRRALRAIGHVPEVSVVTLRRPAGHPDLSRDDPGFVEWSHRWIVGGHWRNQWLPSEQRHEPRWIAPYIKGPDNKPLVADRVYQLVR